MNSIDTLAEFFGWCTVINLGFFAFGAIKLTVMRKPIAGIHAKMFGLSEESLSLVYLQYLAQYKTVILVFNLVPYIALRIIA